jgi:rubrerythrin
MKAALTCLALLLMISLTGFAQQKESKTIDELRIAFNGESTASAKYAAYAEAARKENLPAIAGLFNATSKAESCHAANHKRVMEVLGSKIQDPKIEVFTVGKSVENLEDAIKGETYEFTSMYPAFLKTAETEDISEAIVTYRYALETEKKHAIIYKSVLEALKANRISTISGTWYVCPTCGNVYDLAGVKLSCEFCGTLKPRFMIF